MLRQGLKGFAALVCLLALVPAAAHAQDPRALTVPRSDAQARSQLVASCVGRGGGMATCACGADAMGATLSAFDQRVLVAVVTQPADTQDSAPTLDDFATAVRAAWVLDGVERSADQATESASALMSQLPATFAAMGTCGQREEQPAQR